MNAILNTKKIATCSLAALTLLTLSVFTPVSAAAINRNENNKEIMDADFRLEEIANSLEKAARYASPEVNENFTDSEVKDALENLENTNRLMEEHLRYTAPSVNE